MKQNLSFRLSILLLSFAVLPSLAAAAFTENLSLGSNGEQVRALQIFLATNKNIYPEGLVTGFFGKITEQAVIRFQRTNGLDQVGRVGPKTREILNKLTKESLILETNNLYVPQIFQISTSTAYDTAYIFWTTNKNTKSTLWYSNMTPVNTVSANKIEDATFNTSHSVNISGLSPDTIYYYVIKVFDSKNNVATSTELSFTTLNKI